MKSPSIDELVLLPEPLALQRHFDARNYRFFRWILAVIIPMSLAGIAHSARGRHYGVLGLCLVGLVATVLLILLRRERFYTAYFRQILLGFLFLELIVLKAVSLGTAEPVTVFIPLTLSSSGSGCVCRSI